jgi:2,4-dienoyl-CoA reductase-like NADH-dependent reductase (Old Yellow Enzyme family)
VSILFEPMKIKNMELRNRFVRSATGDGCADEAGHITDKHIKLFADLADGGIGLIITGLAYVHHSGQISPTQMSIASDDCILGLKRLTAVVHERGEKIAVQLSHAGRESAKFLKSKGRIAKGPSRVENDPYFSEEHQTMTVDDIWEIIGAFGDAAKRAREADFDAVQLHGAHAYLLSQFLSPFTNHREDDWGGSLEKRIRFHREVINDINAKAGDDYPVLIKTGGQDGFPGGLELDEGKRAAQLLAQWGYDALEISQGLRGKWFEGTEFRTKIKSIDQEGYFRDWCKEIKNLVNVPVMTVGGLRTFELMEEIIEKKEADFISLCRPFIRQPGLVNEWKSGNRSRVTCISCNKCLTAVGNRQNVRCIQDEEERNRRKQEEGL